MAEETRKEIPWGLIKDTQRDIIRKRKEAVERDPNLITIDRWDLSKVFYDTRTILDHQGYDTSIMNKHARRNSIHNDIADICEELGVKRHEIGIFAADRAQMLFKGKVYNVNFENYKVLGEWYGTDIIFTEKEGLVNTLAPFTEHVGIALVQSGGWSSEYALMMIEWAQKQGFRNIGMLTDFDSSGVGISLQYPNIIRLGVDLQMVRDLGVNLADVEEHIEPLKYNEKTKKPEENSNWAGLRSWLQRINESKEVTPEEYEQAQQFYEPFIRNNLDYLRSNRVELGAITAAVGPQRFWKWLRKKILGEFPKRDYNRAIDVPEYVFPNEIHDFLKRVEDKMKSVLRGSYHGWMNELEDYEGFVDNTEDKLSEIESDMLYDAEANSDIQKLIRDVNSLMEKDYLK